MTKASGRPDVDPDDLDPDDLELDPDLEPDDELVDELVEDPDLDRPASPSWRRRTAIEMAISGAIGLIASFVLSIDFVRLAADPNANLGCSINSKINCATVAKHWAAHLLGDSFPNAFLGIAAEAVVITVAVAIIGGVVFPRWFMLTAQTIYTVGFLFAWWLFYMSYFRIHALCPWCLLITVTTTLVWAGLTRINVRDGNLLPGPRGAGLRRFVAAGNDWFVTSALIVVLAAMVMFKYGYSLL
jgi:uncharacterized membrane protein